jgi:hypothetical protein
MGGNIENGPTTRIRGWSFERGVARLPSPIFLGEQSRAKWMPKGRCKCGNDSRITSVTRAEGRSRPMESLVIADVVYVRSIWVSGLSHRIF